MTDSKIEEEIRKALDKGFQVSFDDYRAIKNSNPEAYRRNVLKGLRLYRILSPHNSALLKLCEIHHLNLEQIISEEYQKAMQLL